MKKEIIEKINKLKKEKNAVILAHCYQNPEIDLVADYVGDSLGLSLLASKTKADIILFAGVYFMAQSAKVLSPHKKVLLPNLNSGCKMADMITLKQINDFKAKHPNIPVVCYINSTAEVKAKCDITCTSANALRVVKSLNAKEVLFVPDMHLAAYVAAQMPDIKITSYPGYCPTHALIQAEDVISLKEKYKDAEVIVHPECHSEVVALADFTGSTTQMMDYIPKASAKTFIICTELGVVQRLERDYPDKKFIHATKKAFCPDMKLHTLEDILHALEHEQFEINLDEELIKSAYKPIERMLKLG